MRVGTPLAAAAAVLAVVATSLALAGGSHPPAPSAGLAGVPPYYLTLMSDDSGSSVTTISATVSASTAPATTASSAAPSANYSSPAPAITGSSPSPAASYSSPAPSTSPSGSPVLGTTGGQLAVIRATVTGAIAAVIKPPRPFNTFAFATGAADDRTFVLAAQNLSGNSGLCDGTSLLLAQFDPTDRGVTLTPLPAGEFPAASRVDAIALSPDGTKLAVALADGQPCSAAAMVSPLPGPVNAATAPEQVRVYSLPSGAVKTWQSAPLWDVSGQVGPRAMSWTWGGMLAFNYPGAAGGRRGQGLWLLNTNAPGGSLLAHSRFSVSAYISQEAHVSPGLAGRWAWASDGMVTPDGRTVVAPIERHQERAGVTGAAFAEFAAGTGAEVGVRWPDEQPARNPFFVPYYSVDWSNSSGRVLVVAAPATRGGSASKRSVFGVLSGDRFTPIPGAPAPSGLSLLSQTTIVF